MFFLNIYLRKQTALHKILYIVFRLILRPIPGFHGLSLKSKKYIFSLRTFGIIKEQLIVRTRNENKWNRAWYFLQKNWSINVNNLSLKWTTATELLNETTVSLVITKMATGVIGKWNMWVLYLILCIYIVASFLTNMVYLVRFPKIEYRNVYVPLSPI